MVAAAPSGSPAAGADGAPLLTVEEVTKHYPGVQALKGVSLQVRQGTIHGLLGENGAGKSTLVGIIAGLQTPSSGHIRFNGEVIDTTDVGGMEARGLFLVPQEPTIVPQLTAAENLMLGRWPRRGFAVDWGRLRAAAREALEGTGIDPRAEAGGLSAVDKRKLNILRVLSSGARFIILDEPTAALTTADRQQLFGFMRRLKAEGVTFLFISHYNEEILEICDAVTVLRDGTVSADVAGLAGVTGEQLSEWIVGRGLELYHRRPRPDGTVAWRVEGVRGGGLDLARLELRAGEIVGFAGLPGSVAKELGKALYGLLPGVAGTLAREGESRPLPRHPAEALERGVAYLSDDRRKEGIVDIFSIADNITLSSLRAFARGGVLDLRRGQRAAERLAGQLRVKAGSVRVPAGTLSGGNQQKVCLGRVITTEPRLLVIDEPARGIDVGAKEEVYRIVDEVAGRGVAVVVITSDLDEILRTVDRICLFAGGRLVDERPGGRTSKAEILDIAFSARGTTSRTAP